MYKHYYRYSLIVLFSFIRVHGFDYPQEQPMARPALSSDTQESTRAQITDWLDKYLNALFAHHRLHGSDAVEFEAFKSSTIALLLPGRTQFNASEITQLEANVKSACIDYIEKKAREYAADMLTKNRHLGINVYTTRDIITKRITNEVTALVTSNAHLTGKLYYYFGKNLKNMVNDLVNAEIRKLPQPHRPQPQPVPTPVDTYYTLNEVIHLLSTHLNNIFGIFDNNAQFTAFKNSIIASTISGKTTFSRSSYAELEVYARQHAVTYIEKKAREYAHSHLDKYYQYLPTNVKALIFLDTVDTILQEVHNILIYNTNLQGKLHNYFGSKLQAKVNHTIDKKVVEKVSQQQFNKPIDYDADDEDCKVCFADYDTTSHTRIILDCGHSLCKTCILTMAARNLNNCPKCRRFNVVKEAAARL